MYAWAIHNESVKLSMKTVMNEKISLENPCLNTNDTYWHHN